MSQIPPLFKREFLGYFRSPVAYVFLIVFLLASVGCAFFLGGFFDANVASLETYFTFLPWLFIAFVPAAGMRLWSEEKRGGTIELLFTLPVTPLEAVLAKFLAAWAFLSLAVLLSFPMALTVAYLGSPDWGVLAAGYLGSLLMAGAYLGICSLTSAFTKNQVISFVISVFICFILVLLGWSVFTDFLGGYLHLPVWLVDVISDFSFKTHFDAFIKGIIDPKDVMFFLSLAGFCLFLNVLALDR
jgi:gliding motility-associated transport system permease protein